MLYNVQLVITIVQISLSQDLVDSKRLKHKQQHKTPISKKVNLNLKLLKVLVLIFDTAYKFCVSCGFSLPHPHSSSSFAACFAALPGATKTLEKFASYMYVG